MFPSRMRRIGITVMFFARSTGNVFVLFVPRSTYLLPLLLNLNLVLLLQINTRSPGQLMPCSKINSIVFIVILMYTFCFVFMRWSIRV